MEAKDLVLFLDRERFNQRISQAAITDMAGISDTGQQYSRLWTSKDGKLSTCLRFLHALGYDLQIVRQEAENGAK